MVERFEVGEEQSQLHRGLGPKHKYAPVKLLVGLQFRWALL